MIRGTWGDPQMMTFPDTYGRAAAVHYIQAEVRGSAVHDLEHTFRERWYGSSVLDVPSPLRQLYDRTYHMGAMPSRPLPEPAPDDPTRHGPHAIQVLRTYAARLRHYPFAPHGERSIAHAYRKAFACARCQVYVEGQYLWSRPVADIIASALRDKPDLHVIVAVPRHPDSDGPITRMPGMLARHDIIRACTAAGGSRFASTTLTFAMSRTCCTLRRPSRRSGGRRSNSPPGTKQTGTVAAPGAGCHRTGTSTPPPHSGYGRHRCTGSSTT